MNEVEEFPRPPRAESIRELAAVARGDEAATLVIQNAKLVNVVSGEIRPAADISVKNSRIAYVGSDAAHTIGEGTNVIDAGNRYVAPGFLDGHCHIESTQLTPAQFSRAVMPRGTTGGFFDAHEITNVLGLPGLRYMLEEARRTPMAAYMQVPSSVPSTNAGFETNGAEIGPDEVAEAFSWGEDVNALGEVMNFPGVVYGDDKMMSIIETTLRHGKVADGHYTWPAEDDKRFSAYAAAGISGDHEITTAEDVAARIRLGMYAKLRRGSAWLDVEEPIKAFTEAGLDTRRMMLVTDDRSPESLIAEGHMDFVIRHAIQQGVPPVTAIQMATLNTAERFSVSDDVGVIAPGRFADIVILDGNLAEVNVGMTIAAGKVVAENGKMTVEVPGHPLSEEAVNSVHIGKTFTADDFRMEVPEGTQHEVRAIQLIENQVGTKECHINMKSEDGELQLEGDLSYMTVIERHGKNGNQAFGILRGIGFEEPAAIATTVAHDSHNLMVIGNDRGKMAEAANRVVNMQGGVAVVSESGGARLPLRVAGLMSDAPYEEVAEQSRDISEALQKAGCNLNYAFMTLSLLALVVIPEIRLSDKGLVRITDSGFEIVPLFIEK